MLLETILTAVLFFVGTALSGYTIRRILKLKQEGFLFSILVGCMGWWALMEVICVDLYGGSRSPDCHRLVQLEGDSGGRKGTGFRVETESDTGTSGGSSINYLAVILSGPSYVSGVG